MNRNSNYMVMNDYEDVYENNYNNYVKKTKKNRNLLIILSVAVVIILIVIMLFYTKNDNNYYNIIENELVTNARKYVSSNNITLIKDMYINNKQLNVMIPNDCSELSGVFILNDGTVKPYLICDNYQSKVINNDYSKITLNGEEVVFMNKNEIYVEQGYSSDYDVKMYKNLGSETGVYRINYTVFKNNIRLSSIDRFVVVQDNFNSSDYPTINLIGDKIIYLNKGDSYKEAGCTAYDEIDGDISSKVVIKEIDSISQVSEYSVIYEVTNSRGYSRTNERKVIILEKEEMQINYYITPDSFINTEKTIVISVIGDNFNYILLPNNTKVYEQQTEYMANDNGHYSFMVYDKDGNYVTENITVTGIDKTLPSLSCTAIINNNDVSFSANASDDNGISLYQYIVDDNVSNKVSSNTYSYKTSTANNVSVMVYDLAGNSKTINCSITDRRTPVYTTNRCTDNYIYHGTKYALTDSQKKKLAAMVQNEYGSDIIGMKAVASHMANLYEIRKWNGNKTALKENLYDYIRDNGWYSSGTRRASKYNENSLLAVEECLVNGNRTIPLYVDEFDWFPGDIINSKSVDSYVRSVTSVKNKYGAKGTFWCMSQNAKKTDANIFFYTSEKYKKYIGD